MFCGMQCQAIHLRSEAKEEADVKDEDDADAGTPAK